MKKISLLNIEPDNYSYQAREILNEFAEVTEKKLERDELLSMISVYDILITRLGYQIDREVFKHSKRLKVVATATTGLDHIDCDAARDYGIEIISLKGEKSFLKTITSTAEHTLALILGLARNLVPAAQSVLNHNWNRELFRGRELRGKTLGIIGYGRIGEMIGRYGQALGMTIVAYDTAPVITQEYVAQTSLEELLSSSDIISVHVPLEKQTIALIGSKEFALMKKTALLINSSRGKIIDEAALLKALRNKSIAGAALDVLGNELFFHNTDAQDPLISYASEYENLLITPHIAGATYDAMLKTECFIASKIKDFIQNKRCT